MTSVPKVPATSEEAPLPKSIDLQDDSGSSIVHAKRNELISPRTHACGQGRVATSFLGKHRTVRTCISVIKNKTQGSKTVPNVVEAPPKVVQKQAPLMVAPDEQTRPASLQAEEQALQPTSTHKSDTAGLGNASTTISQMPKSNSGGVEGLEVRSTNVQFSTNRSHTRFSRPCFVPQLDLSRLQQQDMELSPYDSSGNEHQSMDGMGNEGNSSRISTLRTIGQNKSKLPVVPLTCRVVRCNQALFTARVCTALNLCLQKEAQQDKARRVPLSLPSSGDSDGNHGEKRTAAGGENTPDDQSGPPNTATIARETVINLLPNVANLKGALLGNGTAREKGKIPEATVLPSKGIVGKMEVGSGKRRTGTADLNATGPNARLYARRVRLQSATLTKHRGSCKIRHSESVPVVGVNVSQELRTCSHLTAFFALCVTFLD